MEMPIFARKVSRRRLLYLAAAGLLAVPAMAFDDPVTGAVSSATRPHRVYVPLVAKNYSSLIDFGRRFLNRQYNPQIGLCEEAPNVAPDKYWVYSDGYLAGLDISRWNVPVLTKWTVLVEGKVVQEKVFTYAHRDLQVDGERNVWSEAHEVACTLPDWTEYADRVLLAAINARNAGPVARARLAELMAIANSMWDGRGMYDKFRRVVGCYQTYHVALYYYMTGKQAALKVLDSLQEKDPASNRFGGIYTEYDDNLKPLAHTDVNVETTSVTLRALGWRSAIR